MHALFTDPIWFPIGTRDWAGCVKLSSVTSCGSVVSSEDSSFFPPVKLTRKDWAKGDVEGSG